MTVDEYRKKVDNAKRIVFFGGAGMSTESGIPDFRSTDGLYNMKYDLPPETILSAEYFLRHIDKFFEFYFDKMIYRDAKPNAAHMKLAEWEKDGKLTAVVTQNIDGLHQAAGSRTVYELHGSVHRNTCLNCGRKYTLDDMLARKNSIPRCECGGVIKPDVVLYGEGLPEDAVDGALDAIAAADMLIIGGTSLSVYPAAGFVRYFRGGVDNVVVINKSVIPGYGNQLNGRIGELL